MNRHQRFGVIGAFVLGLLLLSTAVALAQSNVYLPLTRAATVAADTPSSLAPSDELLDATSPGISSGEVVPIVDYDPPYLPEGLAFDKTGNMFVTLSNQSELRRIATDGTETLITTLPTGGFGLLGLAVDPPGNVYAGLATGDGVTSGVYYIGPDGSSMQLPGTETILIPNGLAFDKQGNLFVSDTILGAVWLISSDGSVVQWIQDGALEGTGVLGFGVPVGANGVVYDKKNVYVANTEQGTIVRIPVNDDGSAGTPEIVADGHVGIDGLALDAVGNMYAANVIANELVRIDLATGTSTLLADSDDGLDGSASIAFGTGQGNRKVLFMTNSTLGNIVDPDPGVLKIDVGIPGKPLP